MEQKCKPMLGQKIEGRLYLTDEEKLKIVNDYLSGNESKREVYKRYTGHNLEHGKIGQWLRQFNLKDEKSSNFESMPKKPKQQKSKSPDLETEMLKKRIKGLERKLETAEMKAIAYSTMVDIAEREFNISIRKKLNTNPLKK